MYQPPINTLQAAYGFFLQYQYADQRVQRAFDTVLLELLTTKTTIKGRTTVVTLKPEYQGVEGLHIVEEDVDEQQLAAAMLLQYQVLPETVQREFLEIHTAYTDRSDGRKLYFETHIKVGHLEFEIRDAGAYFADSTTFENCYYFSDTLAKVTSHENRAYTNLQNVSEQGKARIGTNVLHTANPSAKPLTSHFY